MVKEPEFSLNPKEFALLEWAAKQNLITVEQLSKKVIMDYCKDLYIRKKKAREEKEEKKNEQDEIEKQKLMQELVESGELELRERFVRQHTSKEYQKAMAEKRQRKAEDEQEKEAEILNELNEDDKPPYMEGQIETNDNP